LEAVDKTGAQSSSTVDIFHPMKYSLLTGGLAMSCPCTMWLVRRFAATGEPLETCYER